MKKICSLLCLIPLLAFFLVGCRVIRIEEAPREPLEYTIVHTDEIPKELSILIEEKKTEEFQLSFQDGESLYLAKGYGQRMSGGYSIQVQDVSQSPNAIFFATDILGPSGECIGSEPSYPYIVIKMKYREEPVQFR